MPSSTGRKQARQQRQVTGPGSRGRKHDQAAEEENKANRAMQAAESESRARLQSIWKGICSKCREQISSIQKGMKKKVN